MTAAGVRQKYAAHLDDLQRKKATTEIVINGNVSKTRLMN